MHSVERPERGQPLPSPAILSRPRDKFRGYFGITGSFDSSEDTSSTATGPGMLSPRATVANEPEAERSDRRESRGSLYQIRLDSIVDDNESKARFDALAQLAAEGDIPEHYAHSPLCPQHPLHPSGGKGWCPQHAELRRERTLDLKI
jgi:hypothetical protein